MPQHAEGENAHEYHMFCCHNDVRGVVCRLSLKLFFNHDLLSQGEAEAAQAWEMLESPAITGAIGGVIARLQKRAKPAAKL